MRTRQLGAQRLSRAVCFAGVPWQLRRSEVRGVLGFDEVGAARELPSPDRGFSDSDSTGPTRFPRPLFPRNPGASTTMSSGHEGDEERSGGASSQNGGADVGSASGGGRDGGADTGDGGAGGFLWNSCEDMLWSEDDRALLQLPSSASYGRSWPDG